MMKESLIYSAQHFGASESGVPLAAEPVGHFLGISITNSMVFGVAVSIFIIILLIIAAKKSQIKPVSKLAFIVESLVEFVFNLAESNFGSKEKARRHLPFLATLFIGILTWNVAELLPGVGTINVINDSEQVPLLRAFTSDLNSTLAMAVLSIGLVQFYAIKELGILKHIRHYFAGSLLNPMTYFMGIIEVMGEFIRIITLSMRLFGVIYAGEVLLHVIGQLAGNFAWAATLPVYFMELFFCAIQAYIFTMLTIVYLSMATHNSHDDHTTDIKDLTQINGDRHASELSSA
jgi:F-type H+-transporting ATPase subunit a